MLSSTIYIYVTKWLSCVMNFKTVNVPSAVLLRGVQDV